ncbi:DNA-processing protein DprA [Robertmurraya massiliosenegalensis]|uniref:DNA-processing protein DprA n=1 Tax=Robertmurraya TaxID=2837507 RepID=UPI0039A76D89
MDEFKRRLVSLHHCKGIGWKTIYHLLKHDPELSTLFEQKKIPSFTPQVQEKLLQDLHSHSIREQIHQYELNQVHMITIFDKEYPARLKETYEPPWVLYGKGNIELLNQPLKLAVVGSRNATEYGKKAIESIFPSLIKSGVVIVSGLATGIDTLAHETTIRLGGQTIAVIAGGLFHIYPKTNKELAIKMMREQLVLSEYPPNRMPSRWQFPMRNRIISGMSNGTFIVEAKQKSGSLITANLAVNEGREVFALPGNIFSANSIGANELIQQGAKLVFNGEDILNELIY